MNDESGRVAASANPTLIDSDSSILPSATTEWQEPAAHVAAARLSWPTISAHAARIVESYDTGVTLRQLFYRLVADGTLPNTRNYYQRLSSVTAEGRRNRTFPALLDKQSRIGRCMSFAGPADAQAWLRDLYRRDRTEGQPWHIVLGVEKDGQSEQLDRWFTEPLGIAHVALGGYASQSLVDKMRDDLLFQGRPTVLIYAGDHDPTGEDIDRDFLARTGLFDKVVRIGLNADQLIELNIPPNNLDPKVKAKLGRDSRARAFIERHGYLDQYELDAIAPDVLRDLYWNAIQGFWDDDAYQIVLRAEEADKQRWSA